MVSSISQSAQPQVVSKPQTTKTSIFYVNDAHAQVTGMEKLKTAADEFTFSNQSGADKLKFSSGDFDLGKNITLNKLAVAAQNVIGFMANAGGNHEFDLSKKNLVEVLKDNNYKILGCNVEIPETTEENKALKKEISKSYIQEQNGTKYGVIGVFPSDFFAHVSNPEEYKDFNIQSLNKTIDSVQKEVDKLKEQGIDKIILLSHAGYMSDVDIAKKVEGLDVILGGHSHDLIEGISEGKNLFYSEKTGEPTIITQAGKNGKYFGVLDLEFNEKGVITKAQNNVNKTEAYPRSPIMEYFTNTFLGKPQVVGTIKSIPNYTFSLINENPNANFITDAVKNELNVDIALINPANLRANFETGNLTDRDLYNLTPFKNRMCVFKLSEKELIDGLKNGAKSLYIEDKPSGLVQLSGIKYTVNKMGELKSASYTDKQGKETQIDVNNPNPFKKYSVAADEFVVQGGNGYFPNKMNECDQIFDYDKDKVVIDYLKKHPEPVEIKTDGRIKIVDQ